MCPPPEGADIFLGYFMLSNNIVAHSGLFFFLAATLRLRLHLKKRKVRSEIFSKESLDNTQTAGRLSLNETDEFRKRRMSSDTTRDAVLFYAANVLVLSNAICQKTCGVLTFIL